MSKVGQTEKKRSVSPEIRKKLAELAELVALEEYGSEGPPKELTFREIENLGFEVAQLASQSVESAVGLGHQRHFDDPQGCPQCGELCPQQDVVEREILTRLGPTRLSESRFHCDACRRSFFPSADSVAD